jgi:phage head maturation protease
MQYSALTELPDEAQKTILDLANHITLSALPHDLRKIAEEGRDFIIYGRASMEVVDKEGDLILAEALKEGLPQLLRRARLTLNHQDNIIGEILPEYTSKNGVTYKTEVVNDRLMLVANVWSDTYDSKQARDRINAGELHSFSISGKALESGLKSDDNGHVFNEIRSLDLSAVTVCEEGMNPEAQFKVIAKKRDISKPFADYKDFDACVADQQGKVNNPEAYCAAIHHQATGEWPSEKLMKYWSEETTMTEKKKQEEEPPKEEEPQEETGEVIQELASQIEALAEKVTKIESLVYSKEEEEEEEEEPEEEEKSDDPPEKEEPKEDAGEAPPAEAPPAEAPPAADKMSLEDTVKDMVAKAMAKKVVQKAETPRPPAEKQQPMKDAGLTLADIKKAAVKGRKIGDFTYLEKLIEE